MNPAIQDEITSINAIYDAQILVPGPSEDILLLNVPRTTVSLKLQVPNHYPETALHVLGPEASGPETRKGQAHHLADRIARILTDVFRPGEPCVFDVLERLADEAQENDKDQRDTTQSNDSTGQDLDHLDAHDNPQSDQQPALIEPDWAISDPVTEKKSIFLARAVTVHSPQEAQQNIHHLLSTDKKAAKATHNISAWRIRDGDISFEDCDDDGETAAGGRLLHLLELMGLWDVMVVVTRWYGGVLLGPDRFRIINAVARDALLKVVSSDVANTKDQSGKKHSGKK